MSMVKLLRPKNHLRLPKGVKDPSSKDNETTSNSAHGTALLPVEHGIAQDGINVLAANDADNAE